MKSVSGWKIPSPSSWSGRVISLDKGREIWKCFVSTTFPSQDSCPVRTLLSSWESDVKYLPAQSTHFNRAFPSHKGFQIFCCAGSCFERLNMSEPCWGSTLLHLPSPFAFTAAQMLFRDKPWAWRVEQGAPERDHPRNRLKKRNVSQRLHLLTSCCSSTWALLFECMHSQLTPCWESWQKQLSFLLCFLV